MTNTPNTPAMSDALMADARENPDRESATCDLDFTHGTMTLYVRAKIDPANVELYDLLARLVTGFTGALLGCLFQRNLSRLKIEQLAAQLAALILHFLAKIIENNVASVEPWRAA
ncbi:MAG: hypothetical protein M0R06_22055 [Sphaerochaeta sp.]|nr:hypothetical protein [Sphaerochaeta sp.]